MKTLANAALLLVVILGLSVSLINCGGTNTQTVSAETIAKLPPGETLEIDLTNKGTVYSFDDKVDFSRVTIRTSAGVRTFADMLKGANTSTRGGLMLGTPDDMRDHLPTGTSGTVNYDCGVFCKCDGATDCMDMILAGKCSGDTWCSSTTSSCFCTAMP